VNGSIPSFQNAKMLVRDDGSMLGTVGGGCVEGEVFNAAKQVMETEQAKMLDFSLGQDVAYENGLICGGQLNIYVEPVVPQPHAFLFGAGHVSKSLAEVARLAGFATVVVDDREKYASRERFPGAEAIHAGEYEEIFPQLPINTSSYLIIVTRGHRDDMRVLRLAIQSPARFVAMIGSKRKVLSIVKELEKEGVPREAFAKLTAPMGLDIGAVTPEEIAVSVVAEMIAVRRQPESEWRKLSKSVFTNPDLRHHVK
jgi:xanthine dehydrogenase accessory factor